MILSCASIVGYYGRVDSQNGYAMKDSSTSISISEQLLARVLYFLGRQDLRARLVHDKQAVTRCKFLPLHFVAKGEYTLTLLSRVRGHRFDAPAMSNERAHLPSPTHNNNIWVKHDRRISDRRTARTIHTENCERKSVRFDISLYSKEPASRQHLIPHLVPQVACQSATIAQPSSQRKFRS